MVLDYTVHPKLCCLVRFVSADPPACQVEIAWNYFIRSSWDRTCSYQPSVCTAICGDGIVVSGEQCDDGNLEAGTVFYSSHVFLECHTVNNLCSSQKFICNYPNIWHLLNFIGAINFKIVPSLIITIIEWEIQQLLQQSQETRTTFRRARVSKVFFTPSAQPIRTSPRKTLKRYYESIMPWKVKKNNSFGRRKVQLFDSECSNTIRNLTESTYESQRVLSSRDFTRPLQRMDIRKPSTMFVRLVHDV